MSISHITSNRKVIPGCSRSVVATLLMATCFLLSCKKQTVFEGNPIAISVFNGLDNGVLLYGNYSDVHPIFYKVAQQIYNRRAVRSNFSDAAIRARYFADPDTLLKDTPVFDKELQLVGGKTYSMYLTGNKPAIDYLLLENNFKGYKDHDSVTYMQVVNLSNDRPVSVNIKGDANGSLIDGLSFKEATEFMELRADAANPQYVFEFRDADTGDLLTTHTVTEINGAANSVNRYLNKNWSMVFVGKRGGADVNAIGLTNVYYQ